MKLIKSKKGFALLAVLAIAVISAVGAYAYWTTSGAGTGAGHTGTSSAVVVNQTSSSAGLYPGSFVALSGNFDNSNPSAQYVTSVSASVDTFSLQADNAKPACTQADFSISGTSNTPGDVASGTGVGAWSGLKLNMTDALTNQDNCKNITVPISYTSN